MKRLLSILIAVIVVMSCCIAAHADTGTLCSVTYEGKTSGFVFSPNNRDLFADFKGVMPGDNLTQKIIVKNTMSAIGTAIYLRAEVNEAYKDFLDNIDITVTEIMGGTTRVIANNVASSAGELKTDNLLGIFAPGESAELLVNIRVKPEMDNEFKLASGVINWIFSSEEGATTTTVKATTATRPAAPTDITEPTNNEKTTNQSRLPHTGSEFTSTLQSILAIVFSLAIIVLIIVIKKTKKEDEQDESCNSSST